MMLKRKSSGFITLLLLGLVGGDGVVNRDHAERQHEVMLDLFHQIPAPPQTRSMGDDGWGFSFWRPHNITVGSSFSTRLSPPELLAHYNEQMRLRGWQFDQPTVVKDWGRDEGMRQQEYRKDDMVADLTYGADKGYFFGFHWVESVWTSFPRVLSPAP